MAWLLSEAKLPPGSRGMVAAGRLLFKQQRHSVLALLSNPQGFFQVIDLRTVVLSLAVTLLLLCGQLLSSGFELMLQERGVDRLSLGWTLMHLGTTEIALVRKNPQ